MHPKNCRACTVWTSFLLLAIFSTLVLFLGACERDPGRANFLVNNHVVTPTTPPPTAQPPVSTPLIVPDGAQVFLLAGQSNMSGDGCLPPYPADPNVTLTGNAYMGTTGEGYAFGTIYARSTGKPVVLVQCSLGGTAMSLQPSLFAGCMDVVTQNHLNVAGLLFAQGEQDAGFNYQSNWASQFETYVNSARQQLNKPYLPIVYTQIGGYGNNPAPPEYQYIKDQQASITLPNVSMVTTDDLTPTCGGWHFCPSEAAVIGQRLYTAMSRIQ